MIRSLTTIALIAVLGAPALASGAVAVDAETEATLALIALGLLLFTAWAHLRWTQTRVKRGSRAERDA